MDLVLQMADCGVINPPQSTFVANSHWAQADLFPGGETYGKCAAFEPFHALVVVKIIVVAPQVLRIDTGSAISQKNSRRHQFRNSRN